MNNRKFIKQLRKDNIDLSLLRSELGQLDKRRRKKTWKEQVLHVLRSNPVQIVLCALVLIDAVIVIAEIILEIHSEKSTKEAYKERLEDALYFLNTTFPRIMRPTTDWHGPDEVSLIDQMSVLLTDLRRRNFTCQDNNFFPAFNETSFPDHRVQTSSSSSISSPSSSSIPVRTSSWSLTSLFSFPPFASSPSAASSSSNIAYSGDSDSPISADADGHYIDNEKQKMAKTLHHVSEVLHYASIAILALFVFEVILKVICLGRAFFKEKFEVVDAVVILTSFVADIVFVYVAFSEVSVMVIVLLWRIVRVINGLMMHEKQRDEFRIQLQKRARRMSEMKVEGLEIGKEMQDKHIASLEELCRELGASEDQIKKCKPRYMNHTSLQTNNALKSMAAMTTGFLSGLVRAQPNNLVLSKINHFAESPRTQTRPLQTIEEQPMSSSHLGAASSTLSPTSTAMLKVTALNGKPANPGSKLLWSGDSSSSDSAQKQSEGGPPPPPERRKVLSWSANVKPAPIETQKSGQTEAGSKPSVATTTAAVNCAQEGDPDDIAVGEAELIETPDQRTEEKKKLLAQDTVSTSSTASSSFDRDDNPWHLRIDSTETNVSL